MKASVTLETTEEEDLNTNGSMFTDASARMVVIPQRLQDSTSNAVRRLQELHQADLRARIKTMPPITLG